MDFAQYISISLLKKLVLCGGLLCILLFGILLITTNFINRKGIEELNTLQRKSNELSQKSEMIEREMATYSSLQRVEQRAKELGFEKATKIEYSK